MLTDLDRELLDVVGAFPSLTEAATAHVMHTRFGSGTRAWQQVNALIDYPPAMAYAPDTCARLRRVRDRRTALRARAAST